MDMEYDVFKKEILNFIERMHIPEKNYGCYKYSESQEVPVLYASCYAVLTKHLIGEMKNISVSEKEEWARYIQTFQAEDGLFKDPIIAHPGSWYVPPHMEWCGWWHLTCHVIMALTALGKVAEKEFIALRPFYNEKHLKKWLENRDFNRIEWVGNEVLNLGSLLQYERDFHNSSVAGKAVDIIMDWLDKTQDPSTGMWGNSFVTLNEKSAAYQGAYHFFLLYFYDNREIRYPERIIDFLLSMQTPKGGFGIEEITNGCEDIDAIDPLARLYFFANYRRQDIRVSLKKAYRWVLENRTPDGGFAFIKDREFFYGSNLMYSKRNEGSMFATWWRLLSLAFICQVIPDIEISKIPWQFIDCPGYQFWR